MSLEIRNKTKGPLSLPVRSKRAPRKLSVIIIPGIGADKNYKIIEDEQLTEYISRFEKDKLITIKTVTLTK